MKPLYKDIFKVGLGVTIISSLVSLLVYGLTILHLKKYDKIIDTCVFEIKKIDKSDKIKIDLSKSYALDTSNISIWIVHVIGSGENNDTKEIEKIRLSCQIYNKDGNLRAEILNATSR